jgi:hypothetical protein
MAAVLALVALLVLVGCGGPSSAPAVGPEEAQPGSATAAGLDRSKWFRNVELVAARRVGREPVQYVANIFKYHVAYRSLAEDLQRDPERATARGTGS